MKRRRLREQATGCPCAQATRTLRPWCDAPPAAQPHIRHQRIPAGRAHTQMQALHTTPSRLENHWQMLPAAAGHTAVSPHPTPPSPLPVAPRHRGKATSSGLSPPPSLAQGPHGGTGSRGCCRVLGWQRFPEMAQGPQGGTGFSPGWHRVLRWQRFPKMAQGSPQGGTWSLEWHRVPRVAQAHQGGTGSPGWHRVVPRVAQGPRSWHNPIEPPGHLCLPAQGPGCRAYPQGAPSAPTPSNTLAGAWCPVPGLLPAPAPRHHPRHSTLRCPTHARLPAQPPRPRAFPLPPCSAGHGARARAWARPSLRCPPGARQPLPARDASPKAGWHACLPRDSGRRSLPCPSSAVVGTAPTSSSLENLGYRRIALRQRSSRTDGHHDRASSALLPPASEICPWQRWVPGEVPSLRACRRQRSATAHGTHVQQHPPRQRAPCSGRRPSLSRAAPQNAAPCPDGHTPSGARQQGGTASFTRR